MKTHSDKIIGHLLLEDITRKVNGTKMAIQFLKFTQAGRLSSFSALDTTASISLSSLVKKSLLEVPSICNNPLVAKLLEKLPAPSKHLSLYRKDEAWCYALIQALAQKRDFLFIHDDSALKDSSYKKSVQKILVNLAQNGNMAILFTQTTPLSFQSIIEHQIFLGLFRATMKKIKKTPSCPSKIAA